MILFVVHIYRLSKLEMSHSNNFRNISKLVVESLVNIFKFRLRRRLIGDPYGETGLTIAEADILDHLSFAGRASQRELCSVIGIDKSGISRHCRALERKGFVASCPVRAREYKFVLSVEPKGARLRMRLDHRNSEIMEQCLKDFSKSELQRLEAYIDRVASLLGAAAVGQRPGVHPVFHQITRVARAFGTIDGGILSSALSLNELYVLWVMGEAGQTVLSQSLYNHLPIESSVLARCIDRLAADDLIAKEQSPFDARTWTLTLKEKGQSHMRAFAAGIEQKVTTLSSQVPASQIEDGAALLRRCAGKYADCRWIGDEYKLQGLKTETERGLARAYYIEALVRMRAHSLAGERLFSGESRCFAFQHSEEYKSAFELVQEDGLWRARNMFVPLSQMSSHLQRETAALVMLPLFEQCNTRQIRSDGKLAEISFPWLASGSSNQADLVLSPHDFE